MSFYQKSIYLSYKNPPLTSRPNNGRLALAARGNAAAASSARAGAWYGAVQLRGAPAYARRTPATALSAPPSAPPAQLLRAFNGWMDESGLQYTLGAGTLLGAMRNEPPGLLQWEHDVDVYVLARQASLLLRKLQARPPARPPRPPPQTRSARLRTSANPHAAARHAAHGAHHSIVCGACCRRIALLHRLPRGAAATARRSFLRA